jgi:hypothetical protein
VDFVAVDNDGHSSGSLTLNLCSAQGAAKANINFSNRRKSQIGQRLASGCGAMRPSLDFEKGPTRVDDMIGRTIDDFASRTREIASGREVEFILMSTM